MERSVPMELTTLRTNICLSGDALMDESGVVMERPCCSRREESIGSWSFTDAP
jgi:hypothetical protein